MAGNGESQGRDDGPCPQASGQDEHAAGHETADQRPGAAAQQGDDKAREGRAKSRGDVDDGDALEAKLPVQQGHGDHGRAHQRLLDGDGDEIGRHAWLVVKSLDQRGGGQGQDGDHGRDAEDIPKQGVQLLAVDLRRLHQRIAGAEPVEGFNHHAEGHHQGADAHLLLGQVQQHDDDCGKIRDLGNERGAAEPVEAAGEVPAVLRCSSGVSGGGR